MGKRRGCKENIENLSPVSHHQSSASARNSSLDCDTMKTRSGRDAAATSPKHEPPTDTSQATFSASELIQTIASSVSAESIIREADTCVTTAAGSRSPLLAVNEQTPEKSDRDTFICLVPTDQADATPTTNLKILCDAANESFSPAEISVASNSRVRTEPVTPTANLKMLITAASPEIRSLELSKSRLFEDDDEDDDDDIEELFDGDSHERPKKKSGKTPVVARKARSLGILCRR